MILVTGGTGFVGRRVVQALAARGDSVRVLTRQTLLPGSLGPRIDIVRGDLSEPASLTRALSGATSVVHLAATLPVPRGPDAERASDEMIEGTNAVGTRAIAGAASACGTVRQFVHCSSGGVYGDGASSAPHTESTPPHPGNAYERSKLAAEGAVVGAFTHSSVEWTILRPQGIYGPGGLASATFYRAVARRKVWLHGPASVVVHPTFVDDVVHAILLALGRPGIGGETFNIGGERALPFAELIALVAARLGTQVLQASAPRAVVAPVAVALASLARLAGRETPTLARASRRYVNRGLDISKARAVLGFEPVPMIPAIDATIAWARAERLL